VVVAVRLDIAVLAVAEECLKRWAALVIMEAMLVQEEAVVAVIVAAAVVV
jgi:hypothetical protein